MRVGIIHGRGLELKRDTLDTPIGCDSCKGNIRDLGSSHTVWKDAWGGSRGHRKIIHETQLRAARPSSNTASTRRLVRLECMREGERPRHKECVRAIVGIHQITVPFLEPPQLQVGLTCAC